MYARKTPPSVKYLLCCEDFADFGLPCGDYHRTPAGADGRPQRAHIPLRPAFSIHFVDSRFVSAFRMPLRRDPKAL
jgi:hypothetical protein